MVSSAAAVSSTHQRRHGENLHRQVSDGELPVVVVLHVITLQALIVLPAGVGRTEERGKTERVCGWRYSPWWGR